MQSPCTLREAETKKGRCPVSGNGPLMFPLLLDVIAFSLLRGGFLPRILEVRGKSELAERDPIFGNKTAGRGSLKQGSGRPISVFYRTSGIARRKYAANFGTLERTALFMKRNRR